MPRIILSCLLLYGLCACGGSGARAPVEDRHAGHGYRYDLYTVQPGDTLYAIAFRYRLDFRALAAANGIPQPYTIYPGQRMRLAEAPFSAPPVTQVAATRPLPAVNRPQPVVGEAPAREQPAGEPTATASSAAPPAAAAVPPPPVTTPDATPPAPSSVGEPPATGPRPVGPEPESPRTTTASIAKPSSMPAHHSPPPPAAAGVGAWRWPTTGSVVRGYSSSVHKGIDIDGVRGDAVYAVADGTVVYAGTGIVGLGRLLIVKHDEEYLSAYGHNETLHVNEGAVVLAGDKIAEKGSTGTDSVKLHFEVRRRGKPVDPRTLLPDR